MYDCTYCDLTFDTKSALSTHKKTKKCILHKNIGFTCLKCFKNIKGYDNTLKHTSNCSENIDCDLGLLTALINQLSVQYEIELNLEDNKNGTINFKKIYNYIHPKKLEYGIGIPRAYLFYKTLIKYTDDQIMGSHNYYLNDVNNKISRLEESFQFMSVKYSFKDLLNVIWFKTSMSCFQVKDNIVYVLGKIQCQNEEGKKWFGDTFNLKENEKIIKCIWYKDPQLKQFYTCLKPLLKDILNLYLTLGNWALKQKKIKFKENLSTKVDTSSNYKIIYNIINEYNFINLVDNIKKLDSYETFYSTFKNLLSENSSILHSNIEHVFKDTILPSPLVIDIYSLMIMNNLRFNDNNSRYLIDYILPDSEKLIFRSKQG